MSTIFSAEDFENAVPDDLALDGLNKDGVKPVTEPAGFKVPDDYEDADLRGLDAAALLKVVGTYRQTAVNALNTLKQVQQQPAPTRPTELPKPEDFNLTSEDLLGQDPAAVNQKIANMFRAQMTPVLLDTYRNQAQQMYLVVRTNKSAMPYFEDYESEILATMQPVPINQAATYGAWQDAYNRVVANHQTEIVEREVRARIEASKKAEPGGGPMPTARGRGGPAAPAAPQLSADDLQIARALGLGREFSMEDLTRQLPGS